MALIECKLGPTLQYVQGAPYSFALDIHRRAVCQVYDLVHVKCFLSVEHYREVDENPEPATPAPVDPLAEPSVAVSPQIEPVPLPDASPADWQPTSKLILGIATDEAGTDGGDGTGTGSDLDQDDGEGASNDEGEANNSDTPAPVERPKRTRASRKKAE